MKYTNAAVRKNFSIQENEFRMEKHDSNIVDKQQKIFSLI